MESKWHHLKKKAIQLRKQGLSIGSIENVLGISRSTLSGWFRDVKLSEQQKNKLLQNWRNALITARKKAVLWHNSQKAKRLEEAKNAANETLRRINLKSRDILELALAILYLGEGAKKTVETALGSSDPKILKFYLFVLKNVYNLDDKKIRCELYLRADQDPQEIKKFWVKELKLPIENFKYVNLDKRTRGSKTFPNYKGVCQLRCSNVAIQRKLLYLSNQFCEQVIKNFMRD